MRVLVAGSGEWTDAGPIRRELAKLPACTAIICGDFQGADALAAQVARELGLTVKAFRKEPEDYQRYRRGAWKALNERMLASSVDQVLAFHPSIEESRGTKHLVELAGQKGIPVQVFAK